MGPNFDRLQFGNFTAMIRIEGKPTQCYAVDVNKRKKQVTCWIASRVGQTFAVSLKKEETAYHCSPAIFLDGTKIVYKPLEKRFVGKRKYGSLVTSKTTRRPFVFGELSVTDNEMYLDKSLLRNPVNGNIGEIKVMIHHGVHIVRENARESSWNSGESDESDDSDEDSVSESDDSDENKSSIGKRAYKNHAEHIPAVQMVHESSNKAATVPHQIKFGEKYIRPKYSSPKEAQLRTLGRPNVRERLRAEAEASTAAEKPRRPPAVSFRKIKECLVTFVFMYRPIEILQARGIVPSPVPFPSRPAITAASDKLLPEVLQSSPSVPILITTNEERGNELISHAQDAPSPGASHIVAKNDLPSAAEQPPDDKNAALEIHPPINVRLSTPEEEKPTMISLKTAEEDEIDLKISQLLIHLDEVRSKKRRLEDAQNTSSKRVKAEIMRKLLPGERIGLNLEV